MKKPRWDKIIVFLIIFSLTLAPSISIAQSTGYTDYGNIYKEHDEFTDYGDQYRDYGQYSFSLSNILDQNLMSAVIGCTGITDKLGDLTNTIFSIEDTVDEIRSKTKYDADIESLEAVILELDDENLLDRLNNLPDGIGADSVFMEINSTGIKGKNIAMIEALRVQRKELEEQKGILIEQRSTLLAQKKLEEKKKHREECLNGIAMFLARKQLADITQKTVNWINSGYDGDAFFIRDQESFFESLKDQSLQELLGPFANPENIKNYPYGRDFARGLIMSTRDGAQMGLQSTLSISDESYDDAYQSDESYDDAYQEEANSGMGVWDKWLQVTQIPGNSPLGFAITASDYIQTEIENRVAYQTQELIQNNGFLSQKKCVKYLEDEDGTSDALYLSEAQKTCLKWETVTPGQVILDQLNVNLSSPVRQLELADDINSSLNQVFAALVDQLAAKGLSSLDNLYKTDNSNNYFGGYGINSVFDEEGVDISDEYYNSTGKIISVNKGKGWSSANGEKFDITKHLGDYCEGTQRKKGVISIQKDYIKAVEESQEKIGLILPSLGNLDYCLPGPNPIWEPSTRMTLGASIGYIKDMYVDDGGKIVKPDPKIYENEAYDSNKPWNSLNLPGSYSIGAGGKDIKSVVGVSSTIGMAIGAGIGLAFFGVGAAVGAPIGAAIGSAVGWVVDTIRFNKAEKNQAQKTADIISAKFSFEAYKETATVEMKENFETYKAIVEEKYSTSSPMVKEDFYGFDDNFRMVKNDEYLPMAKSGLDLTKNISIYALNVYDSYDEYDQLIYRAKSDIYQLEIINNKVYKIVSAAQERRREKQEADNIYLPDKCYLLGVNPCLIKKGPKFTGGGNIKSPDKNDKTHNIGTKNYCEVTNFSYSPKKEISLIPGEEVTISWSTKNCNDIEISGLSYESKLNSSGTVKTKPQKTTTYTIYATGKEGSDMEIINVKVSTSEKSGDDNGTGGSSGGSF
ncbi:MAG: glycine zipper family protein [Patescibacteria group bacterium]|nr:glycine zipper family protein [Patescibacteria group bacterium]